MTALPLRNSLILALLTVSLFVRCGEKIEGRFHISEAARRYQIDTTITAFSMIDNNGITDEFVLDKQVWYATHHYWHEWGVDGKAWGETYGVAYESTINNWHFMMVLRADVDHTDLEIEWNLTDRVTVDLLCVAIESGNARAVHFSDSMTVAGVTYYDIIELDYTGREALIGNSTPVKTFISGRHGLVRIERKDGVVLNRVP